ncbi:MAG TPA: DNA polymerase III subunit gamma/tau, partial [Anaeromyxobacteraceae bacterium]
LVPQAPLDLTDAERREVLAQAEAAPAPQLTRLFDLAQAGVSEVKESEQPRYAFEVALLKACFLAPGTDVQDLIARVEALGGGGGGGTIAPARSAPAPLPAGGARGMKASIPTATATLTATPTAPPPPTNASAAPADRWRAAVGEVERVSAQIANALKQAVLVALTDAEVSVRMPPGIALSTVERRRAEIEAVLARHFGRAVRLAVTQGASAEPAAGAGAPQSLAAVEQAERDARASRVKAAAKAHPHIQETARILDGEVTKIEEL